MNAKDAKKVIESHLGTSCIRNLGQGCYGCAFLTSENTVVKITGSTREAHLMYLKMISANDKIKGLDSICTIYGIWRFMDKEGNENFIIEREYFDNVLAYMKPNDQMVDEMYRLKNELTEITDIHEANVSYHNNKIVIFDAHVGWGFPEYFDNALIPRI